MSIFMSSFVSSQLLGRVAVICLCMALLSIPMSAQMSVRFTPEPMAVPAAVIASATDMGRWEVQVCNDGTSTVTLARERIDMAAADIQFIDPDDATLVLTSHQNKSAPARLVKFGSIAAQGASIVLALLSKSNLSWSTGLSIGASVAPSFIQIAQGQIPAIAPLESPMKYPITIDPGGCLTDHRFAAKMKGPKVRNSVIALPGQTPPAPPSPPPAAAPRIRNSSFSAVGGGSPKFEISAQVDISRISQ